MRVLVVSILGGLLMNVSFDNATAQDTGEMGLDLTQSTIVLPAAPAAMEQTSAEVLAEEVERRTGMRWPVESEWPAEGAVIVVTQGAATPVAGKQVPESARTEAPESYGIATVTEDGAAPVVWIAGAGGRGALYGVGRLIRNLACRERSVKMVQPLNLTAAPRYPIRGHQLGFRATANSYDAWDVAQYDQYIRELALFGANCVENIPLQDNDSPVMKAPRAEMDRAMSAICARYDLDYWVWTPATFNLEEQGKRAELLDRLEKLFASYVRLDAVFFPGGDPGNNHPRLVMPFLADLAQRAAKHHPHAEMWISLQGFNEERVDYFYEWLAEHDPDWFTGVVSGPSSPPLPETRARLPRKYGHRHYPDITHTVRCQYPVLWFDPAFAFTLGREPVNPQPRYYAFIQRALGPYTDGFLAYSDGIHDDVNKTVWSAVGWDPEVDVRDVLIEYCRVFFGPEVEETAADGIAALEENWEGPLAENASVDASLALWTQLEAENSLLKENWRWQLCLLRAYYDAYQRHRLLYETRLEDEVNAILLTAGTQGAEAAMDEAVALLAKADSERVRPELRDRIFVLCEELFESIGLQSSVERYHASGAERGAVLDFVDFPLNNRWWLEDEFEKVRAMPSEKDKVKRLTVIANWENPGPGGFYDDIGNVAKSAHVLRDAPLNYATDLGAYTNPGCMWWEQGKTRVRQSWVTYMDWPRGLRYQGLDPNARYVVRTTGYGDCLLNINGKRIEPSVDGREIGEFKEFPVPAELSKTGVLELTFDRPHEPDVNWRYTSRLTEVWLLRE